MELWQQSMRMKQVWERHILLPGVNIKMHSKERPAFEKDGGKEEILVQPHFCSDSVNDLPIFDIVVVSVKGYDLDSATKEISKITDKNS